MCCQSIIFPTFLLFLSTKGSRVILVSAENGGHEVHSGRLANIKLNQSLRVGPSAQWRRADAVGRSAGVSGSGRQSEENTG